LKTAVASRTLDNITAVLVSFKNFRKALKNELVSGISKDILTEDRFKSQSLNQ